jgi:nucleotide-binding universal stress UspA family protein
VATDGSERATHAVQFAAKLPLPEAASRTLVHVVRPFKPYPEYFYTDPEEHRSTVAEARRKQEEQGAGVLAAAKETFASWGKPVQAELRAGDPASEIVRLADDWDVDLIIAGARGASLIEGLLMGSVADRLLKEAHCSVLVVH